MSTPSTLGEKPTRVKEEEGPVGAAGVAVGDKAVVAEAGAEVSGQTQREE